MPKSNNSVHVIQCTNGGSVKVITDKDALDKHFKSIQTRGRKLDSDLHIGAVSAIVHFGEHGNTIYMTRACETAPRSARTNALKMFFLEFGGVTWDKDAKVFKKDHGKTINLQGAADHPFWEFKAQEGVAFNPDNDIDKLIGSLNSRIKKAKEAGAAEYGDKLGSMVVDLNEFKKSLKVESDGLDNFSMAVGS